MSAAPSSIDLALHPHPLSPISSQIVAVSGLIPRLAEQPWLKTITHNTEDRMAEEGSFDEPEWMKYEVPRLDDKGPLFTMKEKLSHLDLSGRVGKGSILSKQGGYSDVFLGTYESADGVSQKVAVKQLRVHIVEERRLQRSLARELYIWSKLKHPNVLPFYGFYVEDDRYPNLVSPCMTNGTVMSYLDSNPTADVVFLVKGIAEGIQYLHARGIIHSDIKPGNVLISNSGEPLLCDFGVSRILESSASLQTSTTNNARGTLRYMAKEVLSEDGEIYSKQADVWAFGMSVYTIMTKHQPYHHVQWDTSVILEIRAGKKPSWPEGGHLRPLASRGLRLICESCWLEKSERPSMVDVVSRLSILASETGVSKCLSVIHSQLKFNICNVESSYTINSNIPRLEERFKVDLLDDIKFSSLIWVERALQTDTAHALDGPLVEFFSSLSALYWVEFLSVAGALKMGIAMLQRFIDHFKGECQTVLSAMKWHAFICEFYDAITISAPHLYISALSWGAPNSIRCLRERKLVASDDYGISTFPLDKHETSNELNDGLHDAFRISFSPNGNKFASGHDGGILRIWNAVSCELIRSIKAHDAAIRDVKFSPDGRRIVTASWDRTLRVWDAQAGNLMSTLRGHTDEVWVVAYSPDGRRVVSGSGDMTLRIWDAQNGAAIGNPLIGHQNIITAVSYSPDGCRIASASDDNTLRIWDARSGEQIDELTRGNVGFAFCLEFSRDGSSIVSGCADRTVKIWDTQTERPIGKPLEGHQGPVRNVAYTPDESRIVSASADNTIRIWDARSGSVIGVINRGESRWDSCEGCFLSTPTWWPVFRPGFVRAPLIMASLIHSDAPTQIPDDGWLRTLDGGLFLWVPPKYREDICCRGQWGKTPPRLKFDWKRVPHGKDWTKIKEILEEGTEQ